MKPKTPNFLRVVTMPSGRITLDTPAGLGVAVAPIDPDDWWDDLPRDGRWSFEIISWEQYIDIIGTNPDGCQKIERDTNGQLTGDRNWEATVMGPKEITRRHHRRLLNNMKVELGHPNPDPITLASITYALLSLPTLSLKEIYQIALDSLPLADIQKPVVEQLLTAKIAELAGTTLEDSGFTCDVCGKVCASAGGLTLHKKTHE